MAAMILLAICEAMLFAVAIRDLCQAHDARGIAEGVQSRCEACAPSLLVMLNWPYPAKPFRYVMALRHDLQRMSVRL